MKKIFAILLLIITCVITTACGEVQLFFTDETTAISSVDPFSLDVGTYDATVAFERSGDVYTYPAHFVVTRSENTQDGQEYEWIYLIIYTEKDPSGTEFSYNPSTGKWSRL